MSDNAKIKKKSDGERERRRKEKEKKKRERERKKKREVGELEIEKSLIDPIRGYLCLSSQKQSLFDTEHEVQKGEPVLPFVFNTKIIIRLAF